MGWHFMLDFYRDGDKPPVCTIGNDGTQDLALEAECFGHVDGSKFGDAYGLSIDREFIVGQIEAQSIPFLAFKAGKSALFAILARMLEVGKRPLFLHPPVVGKGLSQMAKLLLRCA